MKRKNPPCKSVSISSSIKSKNHICSRPRYVNLSIVTHTNTKKNTVFQQFIQIKSSKCATHVTFLSSLLTNLSPLNLLIKINQFGHFGLEFGRWSTEYHLWELHNACCISNQFLKSIGMKK